MSNTIELAKSFVPKLDECYRLASLTSVLDGAPELAKQGANANELIIPMMSMDGLADYSRNGGYVQGGVTMTNETVKCNFDRFPLCVLLRHQRRHEKRRDACRWRGHRCGAECCRDGNGR